MSSYRPMGRGRGNYFEEMLISFRPHVAEIKLHNKAGCCPGSMIIRDEPIISSPIILNGCHDCKIGVTSVLIIGCFWLDDIMWSNNDDFLHKMESFVIGDFNMFIIGSFDMELFYATLLTNDRLADKYM